MKTKMMVAVLSSSVLVAMGDSYTIDPAHTTIGFTVRHVMVSNVRGKFDDASGKLETGADGAIAKASATIKAATIDTANADRDKHLRGPDFFDTEKFPTVTFESTKVEKSADGANITGDLTIHGVTKEITLPVTVSGPVKDPWGNDRMGLEGSAKINRKDFGLVWNKALDSGGVVVSDEVKLEISLEATKDKAK